jgi:hypothetical protein
MDATSLTDDELMDQVATWAARIASGEARLLALIGELDARQAWAGHGVRSCAHWLTYRLGWSQSTARERVRVANALVGLPLIQQAFAAGRVTYSQVRAITRAATADSQDSWLALARHGSGSQLDKAVRGAARAVAAERDPAERPERPAVRVAWEDDGDLVLTVRVPAHEAVPLLAVLEQHQAAEQTERDTKLAALLADAGLGGASAEAPPQLELPAPRAARGDDAGSASAEAGFIDLSAVPEAGWCDPREPYPYVKYCPPVDPLGDERCPSQHQTSCDWEALGDRERAVRDAWNARREQLLVEADARGVRPGRATLADALVRAVLRPADYAPVTVQLLHDPLSGWARTPHDELLPPATLTQVLRALPRKRTRRGALAVAADLTRYDQGRASRTVSTALRSLLGQLDGERCRFPGCTHTRYLHAHHVLFWRDGGRTDLANLVLLCTAHHRLLHNAGYALALDADRTLAVRTPDGATLPHRPELPDASAEALPSAGPESLDRKLYGDPFDLGYVVNVMVQHAA